MTALAVLACLALGLIVLAVIGCLVAMIRFGPNSNDSLGPQWEERQREEAILRSLSDQMRLAQDDEDRQYWHEQVREQMRKMDAMLQRHREETTPHEPPH